MNDIMNDYHKNLTINKPPSEVYDAITEHIADWWSNDLSGASAQAGDRFNIAFNNTRKSFDIAGIISNKQVVWKCIKAHIDMASLENKAEWVGTRLIWTINPEEHGSKLAFLHEGLNESFQCYDVCEAGWDYFLASLKTYLETGKGTPHLKPEAKEVAN